MSFAMLFPGQGSQEVGMLSPWAREFAVVRDCLEQASAATGVDYAGLIADGPKDELDRTEHTQPAMLVADVALWRVWCELGGPQPAIAAGHSLGEYAALVAAGVLALPDAVVLVRNRGRWMQEAESAGAMAAVIGLDDAGVAALCADCAEGDVLEAVNFNAPGQVVVAGHDTAVERLVARARKAGARLARKLAVSVPAHSSLMAPVAAQLALALDTLVLSAPVFPVLHNINGAACSRPEAVRNALAEQVHRPVQWVRTLAALADAGVTRAAECGPGGVLCGLGKRAAPTIGFHALGKSPEAMRSAIEELGSPAA